MAFGLARFSARGARGCGRDRDGGAGDARESPRLTKKKKHNQQRIG